jgi:hypothetical protein
LGMSGATHSYAYLRSSGVDLASRRARLQTAGGVTVAGPAANPRFFTGSLAGAEQAAAGLLAVASVAQARYYQPQAAALRDPVVTCNGDRLRFESFSGCCGVYARLDVLSEALDGEVHDRGTTNVDVNGPLREALARVGGADPLHLAVGPDELAVTTLDGPVTFIHPPTAVVAVRTLRTPAVSAYTAATIVDRSSGPGYDPSKSLMRHRPAVLVDRAVPSGV